MAVIRIEDLSPTEKLSPEEIERIFGAGRKPYHLEMEALEARQMMDAALGHVLPAAAGGAAPELAHVRTLTNAAQRSAALPSTSVDALWSSTHQAAGGTHAAPLDAGVAPPSHLGRILASDFQAPTAQQVVRQRGRTTQGTMASYWYGINSNGTLTVQNPTHNENTIDYKPTASGWEVVGREDRIADGRLVKQSWGDDGSYTEEFYTPDGVWQGTVQIQGNLETVTRVHPQGGQTLWYNGVEYSSIAESGQPTIEHWTFQVGPGQGPNWAQPSSYTVTGTVENLEYQTWQVSNHWAANPPSGWYGNGWEEWRYGGPPSLDSSILPAAPGRPAPASQPAGVNLEGKSLNGHWYVGVWTSENDGAGRPAFLGQVYDKQGGTLLGPAYGQLNDKGQWVEQLTGWNSFQSQTNVYDHQGGKLLTRQTVRTVDGGGQVTFNASWQNGKWLETADNYLGFKQATVVFDQPDGPAVQRYGTLATGKWAVDTFNEAGNSVTKREIYDHEGAGKTLLATWTTADGKNVQITETNPNKVVTSDTFNYAWSDQGYVLQDQYGSNLRDPAYYCTFASAQEMDFCDGTSVKDAIAYRWAVWYSKDGTANYREIAQHKDGTWESSWHDAGAGDYPDTVPCAPGRDHPTVQAYQYWNNLY
jgi:hypothetical protein